ncbi:hypothetical protein [Legionella sp. W05-934-2]|uniref:hypothetical protein n=1 Tax=Legionella sp. W05-934-2 TaxID=1198649 RepID=UPI0034630B16
MLFSSEQKILLSKLEFTPEQINGELSELDKEGLCKALNTKKRQISLKYHPDKNKGDKTSTTKYLEAIEAYMQLINMEGIQPSIFDTLAPIDFEIPLDCIDFRMEEQIDAHFEKILAEFLSLPDEEDKQRFVRQHQSFLQFVNWLNKNRSIIDHNRVEAFRQVIESPSLYSSIYLKWNELIIKLFAEENLDDITYREAIVFGHYSHILATRKLLSPIKWLSLLVCGLYNAVTTAMLHNVNKLFRSMHQDVLAISSSWHRVFPLLLKIAGFIALITVPMLFMPWSYAMILLSLPLLTRVLFFLANPINQIIRPVSDYFNISSLYVGIAAAILGIFSCLAMTMLATFTSVITILVTLSVVLTILDQIATLVLAKNLYDISPSLGCLFGGIVGLSMVIDLLRGANILPPAVETLPDALLVFLSSLSNLGVDTLACISLINLKEIQSELFSTLPYPQQKAPDCVKQVVNDAAKQALWSHSLFNTCENAEVQNGQKPLPSGNDKGFSGQHQQGNDYSGDQLLLA